PNVSFVDPQFDIRSEENPQDIQFGERFVARVVRAVIESPNWKNTALFLTYDEHGGYFDHVPPPRAIQPDSTPPLLVAGEVPPAFGPGLDKCRALGLRPPGDPTPVS